jgi:ATP-dependent DNA helicase DinG
VTTADLLQRIFSLGGTLRAIIPGYAPRDGQRRMAELVASAVEAREHALIEAGTGIGKSLAYLVPAIALRKRVVVSTATIALQEQLLDKDIPAAVVAVRAALPHGALDGYRWGLMKGRSQFLCVRKYRSWHEQVRSGEHLVDPMPELDTLDEWCARTETGDRSEFPERIDAGVWRLLDADADDCTGARCAEYERCHYYRHRREAEAADLIVVNHALFFLNVASGGSILPPCDVAILDEAHQCDHWARQMMGETLSRSKIEWMLRILDAAIELPADRSSAVRSAVDRLEATVPAAGATETIVVGPDHSLCDALAALRDRLQGLENWLSDHGRAHLRHAPASDLECEAIVDKAVGRVRGRIRAISSMLEPGETTVVWVQRRTEGSQRGFEICSAPFDVADALRAGLFGRYDSVILASATLAVEGGTRGRSPFAYVRSILGAPEVGVRELVAPSPFEFERQAVLYVAPPNVNPKSADFVKRALPLIEEALEYSRGRAFILCTSKRRMDQLYDALRDRVGYPMRRQGDLQNPELLRWFRETPHAIVCATKTFWEGVDVPGDALSCVIIDRIPFQRPDDPLLKARLDAARRTQVRGDAFREIALPIAVLGLKQGVGRLIRGVSDRGLVLLLDGRLSSEWYGEVVLKALPPFRRIARLDECKEIIAS